MKKISIVLSFIMLVSICAFAQETATIINIGSFNPKATDSGFMLGIGQSRIFDERVEFGMSIDFFSNKYTDEKTVGEDPLPGGTIQTTKQVSLETSTLYIPLMANLTVKMPIEFPIIPFVGVSLGYGMVWDKYTNYEDDVEDTKFFGGMGWRLSAGGLYPLGSRSAITGELYLNGGKPSRSEEIEDGLPTWQEVDMSGLGFRFGIKLYR